MSQNPTNSGALAAAEVLLRENPKTWIVTGVAGFIGSHLLENLLLLGQKVRGLDNFFSGSRENLEHVRATVGDSAWARFEFVEGDIRDAEACAKIVAGGDYVLHQAAVGSVPRSVENPWLSHDVNVNGTLRMLIAARDAKISRFVFASSSAVYGDEPNLPKREARVGNPLSPYALTKVANEQYAALFQRVYGLESVGLRYFNVFGPRQDPNGAYAAVIPKWFAAQLAGKRCQIFGDGSNSRDFCYVQNVVQMNLLAAVTKTDGALGRVYNVGVTGRTTLLDLHAEIGRNVARLVSGGTVSDPEHLAPRAGDIAHSQADIAEATARLGYRPAYDLRRGLEITADWYRDRLRNK